MTQFGLCETSDPGHLQTLYQTYCFESGGEENNLCRMQSCVELFETLNPIAANWALELAAGGPSLLVLSLDILDAGALSTQGMLKRKAERNSISSAA